MATEVTPVDVGVSDADLFENAIADETAEAPVATEAEKSPEQEGQSRDEQGRFAKTEEAKSEPETAETPAKEEDKGGDVPSWRVREINEEKRAAKAEADTAKQRAEALERELAQTRQQMQQLQPKPQPEQKQERPDPIIDPEGYEKWIENRFMAKLNETQLNTNLALAQNKHGEVFDKAFQSLIAQGQAGNRQLVNQLTSQPNPGEAIVRWYREQETLREVGNDPNSWLEKKLEERLADPAFLAKAIEKARGTASTANNGNRPSVQLPPSLSNMSRAESSKGGDDETDLSDEALFRYATR